MVNFRFHLVSLTAVFLALAAGITIGAGVVDRATVDRIETQLEGVAERREQTNAENDRLRDDLRRWGEFSEQASAQVVQGRLEGSSVFLVGVAGTDRGTVEAARDGLLAAGATVDGTLWFTAKWRVEREEDVRQLAGILDVAPTTPAADVRGAALAAVGTAWAVGEPTPVTARLLDAGFFEFDAAPASVASPADLPRPGSLFVVISGDTAEVPSGDVTEPLVDRLSASQVPVLAAQPTSPPAPPGETLDEGAPEPPPPFVESLRADAAVAGRISTVDNIDDFRGRYAAVVALRELRAGRTGHYGFGSDTRIVPELAP